MGSQHFLHGVMEARQGREGESFAVFSLLTLLDLWSLIRRISGEWLYDPGSMGDRNMPEGEQAHEEWSQLIRDWRSVWEPWNEVMDRIALAVSQSGNPSDDDLELEDRLRTQVDAAEVRMAKRRQALLLSQAR